MLIVWGLEGIWRLVWGVGFGLGFFPRAVSSLT